MTGIVLSNEYTAGNIITMSLYAMSLARLMSKQEIEI